MAPINLLWVLAGVLLGMVVGILPGLGPAATIALLLPMTFGMTPASAVIMLAGIYYGAYYGGTITSVLLNVPGESASVVTTFDGYQMARQGRGGVALGVAAIGSFIGGMASVIAMMAAAPLMADVALQMGPVEFTALAILGLMLVTYLGGDSLARNLAAAGCGLLLATIGIDMVTGAARFDFGSQDLRGGVDFVALAMGLFGLGEVLFTLEHQGRFNSVVETIGRILPDKAEMKEAAAPIVRGTVIGFLLGMIPGGGGLVASLGSYALEKRVAKDPSRFGKGALAGVAGPETANNAGSTAAFIPLLTLGLPPNVVLALLYGALLLKGITPGPTLITDHPEVFWGVMVSMLIGNVMLLAMNIPLVGIFVQILKLRMSILATFVVLITMLGVYSVNNSAFDVSAMIVAGLAGYGMRKFGFDVGPLALAFVLGPTLESSFRRSMLMSDGDPMIFLQRPVSAAIFALIAGMAVLTLVNFVRHRRHGASRPPGETLTGSPPSA
jgi:putative tricarboxylic transport membrane protein